MPKHKDPNKFKVNLKTQNTDLIKKSVENVERWRKQEENLQQHLVRANLFNKLFYDKLVSLIGEAEVSKIIEEATTNKVKDDVIAEQITLATKIEEDEPKTP